MVRKLILFISICILVISSTHFLASAENFSKNKEEIILIDVRNHQQFEKFRIPGSINIPIFAIKTKLFLASNKNRPPYAHRAVTIKADLILADMPNPVQNNNLDHYLDSSNFLIQAQAKSFKTETPIQTSENLYHWGIKHVTYSGFSGKDRRAEYAFKDSKGDCTEFMYLFVARCRANQPGVLADTTIGSKFMRTASGNR
nr:transglutaminase domain-containing protein [uncultured Desulfobacter sp.]